MAKRVFFSFHYKDVIDFRANVVRSHRLTKNNQAGYFDASIWEEAKKTSTLALKRLINIQMINQFMKSQQKKITWYKGLKRMV